MMAKSDLHIELSWKALIWLEGRSTQRGIKGAEEVILDTGYIADSAAICGLQWRFVKEWIKKKDFEYQNLASDDYSFIFESKISRNDFFNTFKHSNHKGDRLKPIGNFHFVIAPKGLVQPFEVPEFWGLLEKSGQGLRLSKHPKYIPTPKEELHLFAYNLLRGSHYRKFTLYTDHIIKLREEQQNQDI